MARADPQGTGGRAYARILSSPMAVVDWAGCSTSWDREPSALKDSSSGTLPRSELRETAGAFVHGRLSGVQHKTGWLMSEVVGAERPCRIRSSIGRSRWDAARLRDSVMEYVVDARGDRDGVSVVDEVRHLIARVLVRCGLAGDFFVMWAVWRIQHNEEARRAHHTSRGLEYPQL